MSNEIVTQYPSGGVLFATIRNTSGNVWYTAGQVFETWGAGSRTAANYVLSLTSYGGDLYMADWPVAIANGTYYLQIWVLDSGTYIAFGGPGERVWNGSSLSPSPTPGSPGTALTCQEMIDEIQARCGRGDSAYKGILDVTFCTRLLNEAQREIVQKIPGLPCLHFSNKTTFDTTGRYQYAVTDLTYGDSTTDRAVCRVVDVWYLNGNQSRQLDYKPRDEFDADHPDPTHSDEPFGKPLQWTMRNNTTIDTWPYCASAYWDTDMRFDGDFYPREFTTDVTLASDISMADEGLIRYAVWRAWAAMGSSSIEAKKAWSNSEPLPGESDGWFEEFKRQHDMMIGWNSNLYG